MDPNKIRSSNFHRSTILIISDAFPCPFVCYTKDQATFVANFLWAFFKVKEVHIRGDPI